MMHVYEIHPRKDKRGFDLISDAPPFCKLWYLKIPDAVGYAKRYSRAHYAVISVYAFFYRVWLARTRSIHHARLVLLFDSIGITIRHKVQADVVLEERFEPC
jgi:hypothetical protein